MKTLKFSGWEEFNGLIHFENNVLPAILENSWVSVKLDTASPSLVGNPPPLRCPPGHEGGERRIVCGLCRLQHLKPLQSRRCEGIGWCQECGGKIHIFKNIIYNMTSKIAKIMIESM